ncbi:MAG: hypothetical protein M3Y56_02585, partial [Armatimonadota bacterium]|nr:hypothetical protein [Armatimonadota bacterium]
MKSTKIVLTGLMGIIGCWISLLPAHCQTTTGTTTGTTAGTTAGATVYSDQLSMSLVPHTVANQYLAVTEAEAGTQGYALRAGGALNIDLKGKWTIVTTGGDPLIPSSANAPLTSSARDPQTRQLGGRSNYMVALIDAPATNATGGVIPGSNDLTSSDTVTSAGAAPAAPAGEHAIEFGKGGFNKILAPTIDSQFPVAHQNSRTVTSVWVDPGSKVAFICFLTLLRDAVRFQYSAYNQDTKQHTVGFKFVTTPYTSNYLSGGFQDDAGAEYGYVSLPGYGLQETEARYDRPNIPSQLFAYDALPNYVIGSRLIMSGLRDTVPPDHLIIADAGFATDASSIDYVFKYTPSQTVRDPISLGTSVLEYWDPRSLQPGQNATIVQYYGLAGASEDFNPPFITATEAPQALSYNIVNSTTTTGATSVQYGPNPFPIKGFVYNASAFHYDPNPLKMLQQIDTIPQQINSGSATLSLGPGIQFSGPDLATKPLGDIANQSEGSATWNISPIGAGAGLATYQLTGGGDPFGNKAILNSLAIPATPNGLFLSSGWQMVSFPFRFGAVSPASVLPILATGQGILVRWDPVGQKYHVFDPNVPDTFIQNIVAGAGYWLYVRPDALVFNPFALPSTATPLDLLVSDSGSVLPGSTGGTNTLGSGVSSA